VKLGELGEDLLVERLLRRLPLGSDVITGPGDDCAIIGRPRDKMWTLLKTDCVIEGIHFDSAAEPKRVGWKALCRAISDIAAMGGTPKHALITIAASRELDFRWLESLYEGLSRAARVHRVSIVGGETARCPGAIFISVALTGEVARKHCVRRAGGREGDLLYVTGLLGGSIAGKHLDFRPRVAEAQWLAREFRPSAMMDLSDGLAADLPRLAAASSCGFILDAEALPKVEGCTVEQALGDGEDYELLFAISPRRAAALQSAWRVRFPRVRLTRIGELVRKRKTQPVLKSRGFDHFARAR
jgi:thiamine-monophosphate kinase